MDRRRFSLDANVLVYALDHTDAKRHERARDLVDRAMLADCGLTLQAIGEFFAASRRQRPDLAGSLAEQAAEWLLTFPTFAPTSQAVGKALAWSGKARLQYWDALLLATLREAGCTVLLSEDMQHGADYDGVRVLNPFLGDELPDEIEALLDVG